MAWDSLAQKLLYFTSLGITISVAFACLRRRRIRGAKEYACLAFSQAAWTLGLICEKSSDSLAGKLFWDNFQFLGVSGWGIFFIAFALRYTGRTPAHPRLLAAFVGLPMAAVSILAFADSRFGLIRSGAHLTGDASHALIYGFTPLFMSASAFLFCCFSFYMALVAIDMLQAYSPQRLQMGLVLAGNALPLLGIILTLTGLKESPERDLSPYTFAFGNVLVALGLFRYELFGAVPIALQMSIEDMGDALVVLDRKRRIVHVNPAALSGIRDLRGSPIGRPLEELFPAWGRCLDAVPISGESNFEIDGHGRDRNGCAEVKVTPIRDDADTLVGWVAVSRDMTDRKKLETELFAHRNRLEELVQERTNELSSAYERLVEQMAKRERMEDRLRQAQKMEAVGRLAGGIAHDFNNLLVPILGYAELAKLNVKPGSNIHMDLTQIEEAAQRAAEMVGQILAFSRHQVLEMQMLDLNEEIRRFVKMLSRLIGSETRLETRLAPSLYAIKADKSQLQQILMNLCVNARDAMPNGGRLIIETSNTLWTGGDDPPPERLESPPPLCVSLSVRDSGQGMERETMSHIFEPFYTTKKNGKGTGLGLATVYGIVEQHHGHIQVLSQPGAGTEFRIYFPASTSPVRAATFHAERPAFPQGVERILLVDDDAGVRKLAGEALSMHGYTVFQASGADEAMVLASGEAKPVHLMITDMMLPIMSGTELYRKLNDRQPGLKVLYTSGYSEHMAQVELGTGAILKKPFAIRSLLEAVRMALGQASPVQG